ncbi:MAG: YihY/virulence factor BrkB family protein [Lachnospiraceae bacterium]|nr:YihY/virulence factor BrkB family protein [Lachnospiraceae bacterium]
MVINDFSKELTKNNISALASSAAYFIFMSLLPILMLICSILPYTFVTEADMMNVFTHVLPNTISPLVVNIITEVYDKSPAAISISAVITLWSAAKGIMAIERGINLVNRVEETRNYIVLRCQAALYTVMMLAVVVFFLLIMVFGNVIMDLIFSRFPDLSHFWHFVMHLRFFYVWVALTMIFSLLYTWLPNRKNVFKMQIPGAFICSIVWSAFSWAFSIYVEHFNTFSIYGSLATIIVVMLWLYVCMYIFLIGAEINQYFMPFVRYYIQGRKNRRMRN